jgi:integrase
MTGLDPLERHVADEIARRRADVCDLVAFDTRAPGYGHVDVVTAEPRELVPALTVHRPARVADPPRAIAARTAQQAVARLAVAANVLAGAEAIPVTPAHTHALRHGFALRYLANDGTLARLQQLLGHEDIATTARYVAAVDERRAPAPRDPWAR